MLLLNLLNELGKREKMRGWPSILPLFRNEFNKFNNTRARMLDSIYHMTNTLKSDCWRKNVIILSLCTQRCYGRHNDSCKSISSHEQNSIKSTLLFSNSAGSLYFFPDYLNASKDKSVYNRIVNLFFHIIYFAFDKCLSLFLSKHVCSN